MYTLYINSRIKIQSYPVVEFLRVVGAGLGAFLCCGSIVPSHRPCVRLRFKPLRPARVVRKNPKWKLQTRGPVVDLNGWELRCIDLVALKDLYVSFLGHRSWYYDLTLYCFFQRNLHDTTDCALAFPQPCGTSSSVMSPRKPTGRPPKLWTHRQQRQLIRLYTLTTLSNAEILAVLQGEGFSPRLVMFCRFSPPELTDYVQ